MTYYPTPPDEPCWAMFIPGYGLGIIYLNVGGMNSSEVDTVEAFRNINANRDGDPLPYIVKCLWQDSNAHNTFYEVGERVYAPTGEEPDKTPPE